MKNLKKVLALVLVIAMVMGFAVSASATEFSDADTVAEQNATAVEVLNALNIINGFPDGTYRPTENVTRAQVAKMIAVAFNNGDESLNSLYQNVTCGLTDIGGTWAEGYIKYCYATGIVSGYPDGTFKPENPVTGNELCQIMLNILGYEIDTTNTPWATAVMAKSSSIGLLKNVSTAAGSACPRQEAAQIIYNALTLPILQANAMGVLVPSTDTILSKYLGGSSDVVVVTGNEYADLNGDTPLEAGKTQVDNDTTLNWSTTMDMIGSSYKVWTVGKTVVYYEDAGNTVYETNASTNGDAITAKQVGMKLDGAEQYINYSPKYEDIYTTDIRIAYKYDSNGDGTMDVDTAIKAGETLTATEVAQIKSIFKNASYETVGYVTVGTKDVAADNDVSNEMSWNKFVKEYLTVRTSNTINAKVNENGNTIKVIDNDGDGVADYILKTEYVMDQITAIDGRGTYTLTKTVYDAAKDENVNVTVAADAMVSEDELAKEDVIVYALIDGVYYANIADEAEGTVDSINYKTLTVTCGDETYTQSGIVNDTEMRDEVIRMAKGQSYNLYFDNYGYVRAFIETNYGDYVLLTEMYRDTTDRNNLIKDANYTVEAVDTEGEVANYSVTSVASAVANFYDKASANGLKRATAMKDAVVAEKTEASWTNVADCLTSGSSIDLTTAAITYRYKAKTVETNYYGLTEDVKDKSNNPSGISKGQRRFYFTKTVDDTEVFDYVNITSSTVVYTVYGEEDSNGDKLTKVEVGTGFNAIAAAEINDIHAVYAVATTTYQDSDNAKYPVADVLVIELYSNTTKDFVFGVQDYTKTVDSILSDGTLGTANIDKVAFTGVGFYDTANGTITADDALWKKYVTTGNVHEVRKLLDYVDIYEYKAGTATLNAGKDVTTIEYDETLPVYTVTERGGKLSANNVGISAVKEGQDLIIVWKDAQHRTGVSYLIIVDKSVDDVEEVFAAINGQDATRTLTVKNNGLTDSITVTTATDNEDDTYTANKGTKLTVTIALKTGVEATVEIDGVAATANSDGDYEVTLSKDTTLEVVEKAYTITKTLAANEAGSEESGTDLVINLAKVYDESKKNGPALTAADVRALGLTEDDFAASVADNTLAGSSVLTIQTITVGEGTLTINVKEALAANAAVTVTIKGVAVEPASDE